MPPAISDDEDERSDFLSDDETLPPKKPATKRVAAKPKPEPKKEYVDGESHNVKEDDDDDDDEDDADEYVVEKILNHAWDNGKTCLYEVKWLGYEAAEDRTWEPEDNLRVVNTTASGAMDVLNAYWDKIGGKPQAKPKTPAKKGTKRKSLAQHTPEADATSTTKRRGRKSIKTADELEDEKTHALPEGSWEDHVEQIESVEENAGGLLFFVKWVNGHRTQHSSQQCRQKCPQKLIDYYESKLYAKSSKPVRRRRSTNKA
ncbi:hypothetical protein M436DRAFT_80981 [Aureobasidium namibiae CBS 147.97]|uniref:Chromo domain-containing protein n=1 Tax=Aureobasidium namibiae CBS 147.97 TaxID=1043004 RepID=A0A074WN45_9PEZI